MKGNTIKLMAFILCVGFTFSCSNKPLALFSIVSTAHTAPTKIRLDNLSKKADKYLWDFGDGSVSEDIAPSHRYTTSGKYTITLTAIKGNKKHVTKKEILVEAPHDCLVEIETSLGSMIVRLHDQTPQHKDNFIKLAESSYYDGLLFHRVINGFMIQGGDPDSKNAKPGQRLGGGGPPYTIPAEINREYIHVKGALCAARLGDASNPEKRSSGSQFYLVHGRPVSEPQIEAVESQKGYLLTNEQKELYKTVGGTPFLDKEYTVFGQVIQGIEVIDKIAGVKTDAGDRPLEDVKILKIRVIK